MQLSRNCVFLKYGCSDQSFLKNIAPIGPGLDERFFISGPTFLLIAKKNQNQFSKKLLFRQSVAVFVQIKILPNPSFRHSVTQCTNATIFYFNSAIFPSFSNIFS